MLDWNDFQMTLRTVFGKPKQISSDARDRFTVKFLKPNLFISKKTCLKLTDKGPSKTTRILKTDLLIEPGLTNFDIEIPRQLPKGVKRADIVSQGKKVQVTFNTIFFIQLAAQYFMKKMLDEMILLYQILQFIGYMKIFEIQYPPNAVIYNSQLISFLSFDVIKPVKVIRWVTEFLYPGFDFRKTVDLFE